MDGVIGEVRMFSGNFAPGSWLLCQGQQLPISQYDTLLSVIGTTYGGDGQQTFALPNLCGKLAVGTGNGMGLSPRNLGDTGGSEVVTLTAAQLPAHTHTARGTVTPAASSALGSANTPVSNYPAQNPAGNFYYGTGTPDVQMGQSPVTVTVNPNGGGIPINLIQPFLALNYIICFAGIYPDRP